MAASRGFDHGDARRLDARLSHGLILAASLALCAGSATAAAGSPPRVISLDQCADQYVLALSPRRSIVALSTRADDADSRLRGLARGLPKRRIDLESALALRPQVAVRYWGGDPRLLRALEQRGVRVVTIADASDFDGVRRNVRAVAAQLAAVPRGQALIAQMNARLARSADAWRGAEALYLTPSGVTGGPGTLVDAVLRGAGMTNVERRDGYQTVSLEQMALAPPGRVVLGFFDTFQLAGDSWGAGRHQVLQRLVRERAAASLPGSTLGCPDWSAAEAVELLAAKAPKLAAPR